ncbi:MAG: ATP-binding protein [Caulobacteraceae bacterium]|nr:ATP-binding protein [Caulobacteraceae bacterium]
MAGGDIERDRLRNLPDPSRLIFGLRDTGYDFNTAAADIIDNAIAANATEVNVRVELQQDGRKFVYFGDNGDGMDSDGLFNAMRYGAPKRASAKSLGKFGLGLKTASSSICRRYGLISRARRATELGKLEWDLDHVEDLNDWQMLQEPVTKGEEAWFEELCGEGSGTLVVWSKCDRLLSRDYAEAGGTAERNAIKNRVRRLKEHLSLVFHRYLDPADDTYPTVRIHVNDEPVEPWNPFFPEKAEQVLPDHARTLKIGLEDGSVHEARMNAWILPHSKDLTKEENEEKARISSRAQGFYIYREGRIIHHGGWLGVFRSDDPHYSLLRVEFDFDHQLDDAFKIDVKKSRILFDPALEESLRKTLTPFWNEADRRYRRKVREEATDLLVHGASSNRTLAKVATKAASVVQVDPSGQEVTVNNNRGAGIRLHIPVNSNVDPDRVFIEAVDDITSGHVWEPAMRSTGTSGHRIGVRINRHHDFYQKIYLRTAALGDAVEGLDFLLWAFAAAEQNNSDPELAGMFEDIREEISSNLRRLLKDTPAPSGRDLEEIAVAVAEAEVEAEA